MSTLSELSARRMWYVSGFRVYGTVGEAERGLLLSETANGVTGIFYAPLGNLDASQTVSFSSLIDHRGNALPVSLSAPRVIIRPVSSSTAFVVGSETNENFRIARSTDSDSPAVVDLLVLELGE